MPPNKLCLGLPFCSMSNYGFSTMKIFLKKEKRLGSTCSDVLLSHINFEPTTTSKTTMSKSNVLFYLFYN
jgi:hypothetical protein